MFQPLIVTGMHRSGTSLLASLIQAVGIHLGDRFVEADAHNAPGYFEDREFLEFQRWVLQAACPDDAEGWTDWGWTVSERLHRDRFNEFGDRAQSLLDRRLARNAPWGWKDPRTSLMLDFWQRRLSDPKFVFVYRNPWDVADSIARLNAPVFEEHPDWGLRIWAYYNRNILDFYERHRDRCLLVHTNAVLSQPRRFSRLLQEKLGIVLQQELTPERVGEIYDPQLLKTLDWQHPFAESVRQRSPRYYLWLTELDRAADLPSQNPDAPPSEVSLALSQSRQLPEIERSPSTESPPVTVVIPCYNHGEFLLEAIASVQSCQPPLYSILVVNDASDDPLTLTVLRYLKHKGFTVLDHAENQGLAAARNTGFREARSPYVLPLDADNKIRPDYILRAIEVFQARPEVGVVYGDAEYIGDKSGVWNVPDFDINRLAVGNYIDACAVLRKAVWEDCGGYDSEIPDKLGYEDWDLWLSAAERGWQFQHLPEVLFEYRVRRNSMVSRCDLPENRMRLMHYLCAKHLDLYVANFPSIFAKKDSELLAERRTVAELKAEIETLQREGDRAATELTHYQTELHHSNLELQQAQSQLFPTEAELDRTRQERDDLREEVRHLHPQLYEARQAIEGLERQLEALHDRYRDELLHLHGQLQAERAQAAATEAELRQALTAHQDTIAAMESTKFWKLRRMWFKVKTPALQLLGKSADGAPLPPALPQPERTGEIYRWWLSQNYPRPTDIDRMTADSDRLPYQPTISVVMPVYNTPANYLEQAIESVLAQAYPHWQLCIADDASTQPHVRAVLERYTALDSRICVAYRTENGHISRSSNTALELATGEFVALLDHDDLLTPDALYEVVRLLNDCPDTDMVYSDEDKVDENNQLKDPFFKPDWCPDSFLSRMYTCHLGVYRRCILEDIGGFRAGFEGAQDYDLVLRFTERLESGDRIRHLPKILYHWRSHPASTASRLASKSYATDAAAKALTEALARRGEPGIVVPTDSGHWIPRYQIRQPGKVTVIIPTKDLASVLDTCLTSIFKHTTYPDYEVLVVDNGSVEPQTQALFESWRRKEGDRFRVELLDIPFNYSKLNNFAASKARGDYLLLLNNDTEVTRGDWMTAMVEQAQRDGVGAVGATLLYPDNTIQHAGVVLGIGGVAGHSHKLYPKGAIGYFAQLQTVNNYSAVTAACLMCRRSAFEAVGGFEEKLGVAFNDVDFCLKLIEKGYRNLCLPHVVLYHYESKSRGQENTREKQVRFKQEIDYMKYRWRDYLQNDPCYNPHLSRDREDYSLAVTHPLVTVQGT